MARYLDEFSLQAKTSGGRKLAIAEIIRAMPNVLKKMDLDVTGAKTEKELEQKILEVFTKYKLRE